MTTAVIPMNAPGALERALFEMRLGNPIAFPTDTVYGLAVTVYDEVGIENLFKIKGRSISKAIAVLIGERSQLNEVAIDVSAFAHKLADHFWPGAITLVIPRNPELPSILSPLPTVGVRMPDHDLLRMLIQNSGPLATTSANLSGEMNCITADEVIQQLGGRIPLVLDGGRTPGAVPSTVVDCTGLKAKILRQGKISEEEILSVFHDNK